MNDNSLSRILKNETSRPSILVFNSLISASVALVVGAFIDNLVKKIQDHNLKQNKCDRKTALVYFSLQLVINIIFITIVSQLFQKFVPWLQLTVSGLIFSVMIFSVQQNFAKNILIATEF